MDKKEEEKRRHIVFGCRSTEDEKLLIESAINKHRETRTQFLLDASEAKLDGRW